MSSKPVIWLTGLSGAGKSTLANSAKQHIESLGHSVCVLDGDDIRSGVNLDLGFSLSDRTENIRRAAEMAKLLSNQGHVVICALVSPHKQGRDLAKDIIGSNFHLVHVDTSIDTCMSRDAKGLYSQAKAGKINNMTGIGQIYDVPDNQDFTVSTGGDMKGKPANLFNSYIDDILNA